MKFAAVFVILAVAFAAEASVVGWGPTLAVHGPAGPLAPVALAAPGIATSWGHAAWGPAAWGPAAWGPAAYGHGAWGPAAWAAPVPAPAAITAHAGVVPAGPIGHEGSYVAKTRGAVHVAPLAGHAHSAASINVLPAPGTV